MSVYMAANMKKQKERSFGFSDVHIDPQHQIGMHRQHSWELSYVSVGSGLRTIGGTTEPFKRGEVVLVPPEIPHCWLFYGDDTDDKGCVSNISLMFGTDFLDNCASSFPEMGETILKIKNNADAVLFDKEKSGRIIALLGSMTGESDAERVPSAIKILNVIAEGGTLRTISMHKELDRKAVLMDKIETYTLCNFRRRITLGDIAAYVGMNRSSFCVFFRNTTGKSFINYLNELRIDFACEHLKKHNANIAEICYQSGFNDIPYFNRLFKRIKGISPREYRK